MSEVFISYARATEPQADRVAEALRGLGFEVWRDDALPAHRAYGEVIEERLRAAKAVVVLWSAEALKSQWVRSEADVARKAGTLVQLSLDGALPPLPFDQVHCVDLAGWTGDTGASGWRKVAESIGELVGRDPAASAPAPPPLPDKPSIAVLPFANLSKEADQDYFVEGMMDEIVTALTRIHSLFVIASASSLSLKGQDIAAPEAARRLGVRYILEGSVRRAGPKVRIAVKLTDARGGDQIWAERFEDTLDDVFALQDHVALSVAGVIEPTVQAAELRRIVRRPLESLGCYDIYLRAASLRATLRKAEVLQALELLERALALDPDFAPALAQAAGCHSQVYVNNWSDEREEHRRRGLETAQRAIAAGADDAAVLSQVANAVAELDNDTERAAALAQRATRLNPGSAYGWFISGIMRLIAGKTEAAIEELETAARLDPISRLGDMARAHVGAALAAQRDFNEADRVFRGTTFRTPRIRLMLVALYGHLGM
ncbi:MAG TPA: TIR domain-containing protein, partial [Phenylobacterium sp.]